MEKLKSSKDYRYRLKTALIWYGALSLIVIPIFTLIMGTRDNILSVSMSAMGNTDGWVHLLFIIWTISFCVYFSSFVGYLLILTQNTHSRIRILVSIATVILIIGNLVPFLPDEFPMAAELHNVCAQISSVSLAVTLMLLALTLHKYYPEVFKKAIVFVLLIWAVLVVQMSLFGTVSFTEMSGIILACIFLFTVARWLFKTKDFDIIAVESIKDFDADQALEEVEKLEKKAAEAKEEYMKWEIKLRRARTEAIEKTRLSKKHNAAQNAK